MGMRLGSRLLALVVALAACSTEKTPPPSSPNGSSLPPPEPDVCRPSGAKEASCDDGIDNDCDGLPDCADDDCAGKACGLHGLSCAENACVLPGVFSALPPLDGLTYQIHGDNVVFSFVPREGARDYRVWVLEDPDKIDVGSDGELSVAGAVYRCAGDRPLLGEWEETRVSGNVLEYRRPEEEAILGYAYPLDGPGRVPVFALGDPSVDSDERTGSPFASSRVTTYTASREERDRLLSAGYRDDGIAFYAPESGERQLHHFVSEPQAWQQDRVYSLYYAADAEHKARQRQGGMLEAAFTLLAEPAEGTLPVYRVTRRAHDLLALGAALRDRYLEQGNQPVSHLSWSGLEERTTLVLEALDAGCPFTGHYAAKGTEEAGYAKPFLALPERIGQEVIWINGQHDPASEPRVVARSFVTVEPGDPPSGFDFAADFHTTGIGQVFTETGRDNGLKSIRLTSELFDVDFYNIELASWTIGDVLGQFWVGYADWAADTNGKFRMTAKQKAELSRDSFVHVSAQMEIPSTLRRYPQILISDQEAPVQDNLRRGATVIVQPFGATTEIQIQVCKQRTWDVNDQCPKFRLGRSWEFNAAWGDEKTPWPPAPVAGEVSGFDLPVLFDVYVSTRRVYVFMNGAPVGCGELPDGTWSAGPVTATLGDVLYHSGVDEEVVCRNCPHRFLREHRLEQTLRRFDSFAFRSGAKEPAWNEVTMPCSRTLE